MTERDFALIMEVSMWATDAKECPICKKPWTVESIKERNAIVGSVTPRVLVCESECWPTYKATHCGG